MSNIVDSQIDVSIEGAKGILRRDRELVEMTPAGEYNDPHAPENQEENDISQISDEVNVILQDFKSYLRTLKEESLSRIRH